MFAVFFVWFASIVKYLSIVFGVLSVCMGSALLIWFIGTAIHNDVYTADKHKYPLSSKGGRWLAGVGIVVSLLWAVIPSEKTVYLMGGAYVGQSVIQSETAGKVKSILDNKLDQILGEMEKKTEKAVESVPAVKAVIEKTEETNKE